MTEAGLNLGSEVALLVPHPTRLAVLAVAGGHASAAAELPTLRLGPEPTIPEIMRSVDVIDPTTAVPLRLSMTSGQAEGAEVAMLLEFDAAGAEAPAGWIWRDLDASTLARLEPAHARAPVSSWAREREEGWSPLRPPWSKPGWFARASAWMLDQMAADGRPATRAPQVHHLWDLSVVLRAPSTTGNVFLKCSPDLFRHEAAATQALATHMPQALPDVVAVDGAQGWLLMRDLGAPELGEQDQSLWHEGLVAHAGIQQVWQERTGELVDLGLPVRSLPDLAAQVDEIGDDDVLQARMSPDMRQRWGSAAPTLAAACLRLDGIGPDPSLVHGDLHPWNITFGSGTTRIFDWTDAAVSHPFVDLATYVFRTVDVAVRRRLVDAYLGAWSTSGSKEDLREAAELAVTVGSLYQVQTYRALIPTLMGAGNDVGLAGGDMSWIERTLTRQELGLDSTT